MIYLKTIYLLCFGIMLLHVVLVSATPTQVPRPAQVKQSIDDQIKKTMDYTYKLFEYGLVLRVMKDEVMTRLYHVKDDLKKVEILEKNKTIPDIIFGAVMKNDFWIDRNMTVLKKDIKRDFNNGTLTKKEVEKVYSKLMTKLRRKTKSEINLAIKGLKKGLRSTPYHFLCQTEYTQY
uniref:Uncharacterized protein n=1 Tax=Cacopsylla melanoneura TaxID=428564 RepID=A0A8D8QZT3_9HEMI